MIFLEISVKTDSSKTELTAFFVERATGNGAAIFDGNDLPQDCEYIDDATRQTITSTCEVKGFCSVLRCFSAVSKIRRDYFAAYGEYPVIKRTVKNNRGYLSEYKKWEYPVTVGEITVSPSMADAPEAIVLDSVLAFGNGQHETTALCIGALQDIDCYGKRVLDVGCGSGILGICALRLGAVSLFARDYDKEAVKATLHNAKINGYSFKVEQGDMVKGITDRFDIVMANITADILMPAAYDLVTVTAQNGFLLLSGMLNTQVEKVLSAFSPYCTLQHCYEKGEWSALLLRIKENERI